MKKTLAIISTTSYSLVLALSKALEVTDMTTLSLTPSAQAFLKRHHLSPMTINPNALSDYQNWTERDTHFTSLAMPGCLGFNVPTTKLPAWQMLSLDRLSFWFEGRRTENVINLIEALEYDRLIVSLDLSSTVIWSICSQAIQRGIQDVIAVQCGSLRTREFLDLAHHLPFTHYHVWSEQDKQYLGKHLNIKPSMITVTNADGFQQPGPAESEQRNKYRSIFNIDEKARVALVLFESQTEHAFRVWLNSDHGFDHVLLFPVTETDRNNLFLLWGDKIRSDPALHVIDDLSAEAIADVCVMFRFVEGYAYRRIPVQIIDGMDRFKSSILAAQ